jgi:hypothetical protein
MARSYRRRTRKRSRLGQSGQSAGAAIAEGRLGCVYYPAFPCIGEVPKFPFPVVSKLVLDTKESRREILHSYVVREKLVGMSVAVPVFACQPAPPTAEEFKQTFAAKTTCTKFKRPADFADRTKLLLIYMPMMGTATARDFLRGVKQLLPILHFYSGAFLSIVKLATSQYDVQLQTPSTLFLAHCDLHDRNILALPNGTSVLCDFGMSITDDPRVGAFHDTLNEWWIRFAAHRFEDFVGWSTVSPTTTTIIAMTCDPEVNWIARLRAAPIDPRNLLVKWMGLGAWQTYINYIAAPRLQWIADAGVSRETFTIAAIRFNDIRAFCLLLMDYIGKLRDGADMVRNAHMALMRGQYGGYMAFSFDEVGRLAAIPANKFLATALFVCAGAMEAHMFIHGAPKKYEELWLQLIGGAATTN